MLLFVQKYAVSVVRILLTVIAEYCSRTDDPFQRLAVCVYVREGAQRAERQRLSRFQNESSVTPTTRAVE